MTEGIIMRSKTDWYEHGEKSMKYFLNLEKRNKPKSHKRKIITADLRETSDPTIIMSNLKIFYGTLYKSRSHKTESECLRYLDSIDTPKLSEDEKNLCEGKLMVKECWDALISMGANKSPGNDGLSKEFYICSFKEIYMYLIHALNHSFSNKQLSNSQRQAMITLIEKKGKDKRYLKNWRPISLINIDAKIASKAIAMRIKTVTAKLVHCDQTAYVNNRYIGESNHLISDILEYTNENEIEAILFSADFERVFDSIEHLFLFAVLKSFGFSADFIQWIRTFFNNAESCVINNGNPTGYFLWKEEHVKGILFQHTCSFLC